MLWKRNIVRSARARIERAKELEANKRRGAVEKRIPQVATYNDGMWTPDAATSSVPPLPTYISNPKAALASSDLFSQGGGKTAVISIPVAPVATPPTSTLEVLVTTVTVTTVTRLPSPTSTTLEASGSTRLETLSEATTLVVPVSTFSSGDIVSTAFSTAVLGSSESNITSTVSVGEEPSTTSDATSLLPTSITSATPSATASPTQGSSSANAPSSNITRSAESQSFTSSAASVISAPSTLPAFTNTTSPVLQNSTSPAATSTMISSVPINATSLEDEPVFTTGGGKTAIAVTETSTSQPIASTTSLPVRTDEPTASSTIQSSSSVPSTLATSSEEPTSGVTSPIESDSSVVGSTSETDSPPASSSTSSELIFTTGGGRTAVVATSAAESSSTGNSTALDPSATLVINGTQTFTLSDGSLLPTAAPTSGLVTLSVLNNSTTSELIFSVGGGQTAVIVTTPPANDAPTPDPVTSRISTSHSSTSTGTKGSKGNGGANSDESTAGDFFDRIGKSPVSITLSVIVSLVIAGVVLGIVAFLCRRQRRRRRSENGSLLGTQSHYGDTPRSEDWQEKDNPFNDRFSVRSDGGDSAGDVLPGAIWARRPSRSNAVTSHDGEDRDSGLLSPNSIQTDRKPSSDWTSIVGDGVFSDDGQSRRGSIARSPVSTQRPLPGATRLRPHPLRQSFIPAYSPSSIYSPNSILDQPSTPSDHLRLLGPSPTSGHSRVRNYRTMADLEQQQASPNTKESWRLSLDRVMGAAAEFVNGRSTDTISEVSEGESDDHYTSFSSKRAVTPRRPPMPPWVLVNPPASEYSEQSSTYSSQFAYRVPSRTASPARPNTPSESIMDDGAPDTSAGSIGMAMTSDEATLAPRRSSNGSSIESDFSAIPGRLTSIHRPSLGDIHMHRPFADDNQWASDEGVAGSSFESSGPQTPPDEREILI